MPYTIKLDLRPTGYSLSAAKRGEKVQVAYREFLSSEDGDVFISRLEGFPTQIVEKLPPSAGITCSTIDHLFAIVRKDNEWIVFANELPIIAKTRIRRAIKAGEPVFESDIVDIDEFKFDGVEIPDDAGVFVVFSKGWRKGLFYDLGPLQQEPVYRNYDFWRQLGSLYNYLCFQDFFKITDEEYTKLFSAKWFPFLGLKTETARGLVEHVRSGWNPDDLLPDIVKEVEAFLPSALEHWKSHHLIVSHFKLIERAVECFQDRDYVSCVSILYPRIEGILREISSHTGGAYKQDALAEAPMKAFGRSAEVHSRILPARFRGYLETVYFENFDPDNVLAISRNTVAHGVAPQALFNEKAASIALLIIEQVFFHLPDRGSNSEHDQKPEI